MSNGPYPQRSYEQTPDAENSYVAHPYATNPYAQSPYGSPPGDERPVGQVWEQPSFTERDPQAPVWGQVIVPAESRLVVAAPTPQEETLRTIRRLVFPVALVLAIVTGHWFPILVIAIIVSNILRRQLWQSRQRRLQPASSLR